MDKYYTPTIEEFHVGFEFECMPNTISEWKEYIFKPHDEPNYYIERGKVRVKYLDREDIESLGFIYHTTSYDGYYEKDDLKLMYDYDKKISIHQNNKTFGIEITLFRGTIRNKSELKNILKIIG